MTAVKPQNIKKIFPFVISFIIFIVFIPSLFNNYVDWDDAPNIVLNTEFRGLGLKQLKWMFTTFHMSHYQPLSWLSLGFDYVIWGVNPFGYHLISVLLHCLGAFFLYHICAILFDINKKITDEKFMVFGISTAVLLYAIHPLRVEPVSWITERRDVLSTCLFLLSVLLYLQRFTINKLSGNKNLILSFLFFLFACFSKSMAVTLPAVLLLLDIYPLKRLSPNPLKWLKDDNFKVFAEKIPFLIISIGLGLFYYFVVGKYIKVPYTDAYLPSADKAVFSYWFYLYKMFLPFGLAPVYTAPQNYLPVNLTGAFFVLAFGVWSFIIRKQHPAVLTALVFYIGTLFPVCGLINGAPQPAADRYCYIPTIAFAIVSGFYIAYFAEKYKKLENAILLFTFCIIGVLLFLTVKQQAIWNNSKSLWEHTVKVQPLSAIAYNNLASFNYFDGKNELAIQYMEKAVSLDEKDFNVKYHCGYLYERLENYNMALKRYNDVILLAPKFYLAYLRSGIIYEALGKNDKAEEYYLSAIQIDAEDLQARYNLANIYLNQNKIDDGKKLADELLNIQPDNDTVYVLQAALYAASGDIEQAVEYCDIAVKLAPDNEDAVLFAKRLNKALENIKKQK